MFPAKRACGATSPKRSTGTRCHRRRRRPGVDPLRSLRRRDRLPPHRRRDGNGRLGSGRAEIVSRIPFNLEPKLPLEVNAGDRIDLPLAIVNDTKAPLPVELQAECGKLVTLEGWARRKLTLPANQRSREYFVFNVTGEKGRCD